MEEFWNERYDTEVFVYGKDPNQFFSTWIRGITPGRLLLPGEGEGRNAVYAASMGWEVEAFDQSMIGQRKAEKLAEEKGVRINYQVSPVEQYPFPQSAFDAIGLVYVHLMPDVRERLHDGVVRSLRPGALVILEAFHKQQINNPTGGPTNRAMLYDREILVRDFNGLETLMVDELRVFINEGPFHNGEADVIRYIGRKL